jgi:DNA-binding NarL/FixJ family response regulator
VRQPSLVVLLLSSSVTVVSIFAGGHAGVAGFIPRTATAAELLETLQRALHGDSLLDEQALERPVVASQVLREIREMEARETGIEPLLVPLSSREIEVLDQIARGNSNKRIAQSLTISDQTVKNHITSILRKLAVNDRTQAVVMALHQGWIQIGQP